jgi:lysozyme
MNTDRTLLAELRRDEGVVRHAYQDSRGLWTIGVGRLIDERKGGGLSDEEIDHLLANDVSRVKSELDKFLPWWRDLDAVRQRALINMCFNLGIHGLLGFRNTLAAIQAHDWPKVAAGMLDSRWARQTGARAHRLAHMMETGEAPL